MFEQVLPDIQSAIFKHQPNLVLIDGPAGAGKTSLADLLQTENSQVLHLDDYYAGWDEPFDEAFQKRLEIAHAAHSSQSELAEYQRFNWKSQEFEPHVATQKSEIIIFEGVGSFLYQPTDQKTLKIFITTDYLSGLNRVVLRDGDASAPFIVLWKQREFELFGKYDLPAEADFYLTT